jgi:hypothetical protein
MPRLLFFMPIAAIGPDTQIGHCMVARGNRIVTMGRGPNTRKKNKAKYHVYYVKSAAPFRVFSAFRGYIRSLPRLNTSCNRARLAR